METVLNIAKVEPTKNDRFCHTLELSSTHEIFGEHIIKMYMFADNNVQEAQADAGEEEPGVIRATRTGNMFTIYEVAFELVKRTRTWINEETGEEVTRDLNYLERVA